MASAHVRFAEVTWPAYVLAVPPSALWPETANQADSANIGSPATESADGPSPCGDSCHAATLEAANYVEIVAEPVTPNPLGHTDEHTCDAAGALRTVTAVLRAPLGNRIWVDSAGRPITATAQP